MYVCYKCFIAPVCFNTTYCGGESVSEDFVTAYQCCKELFGVSFASPEHCLICPKGKFTSVYNT